MFIHPYFYTKKSTFSSESFLCKRVRRLASLSQVAKLCRPAVNPDSYHGTFANSPSAKPITQYSSPETTTAAKPYEVPAPVTQAYPDYEHSTQSTTSQTTPSYSNPQITESPKTTTQPEISTTSTSRSYSSDEVSFNISLNYRMLHNYSLLCSSRNV